MVTSITIRVRGTRSDFVRRLRRELLADGFNSASGQVIAAHLTQEVLRDNLIDFKLKSRGGADRMGKRWKPLAEKTIRQKTAKQNELLEAANRRQASVSYHNDSYLKHVRRPDVRKRKNRAVARRDVLINIDTTDLIRSLSPGSVSGGIYRPSPKQVYRVNRSQIKLGTRVRYAEDVNRVRPIGLNAETSVRAAKRGIVRGLQHVFTSWRQAA